MKYNINLIGKTGANFFEKAIFFFSNYFRYILVITQLVVILTLFARFQIDQNIIDLKDSLDQKKEIVKVTSSLIQGAEKIDLQTAHIRKVIAEQKKFDGALNYILSSFPRDLLLSSFTLRSDGIEMAGTALNSNQLQLYYNFLKKDKRFSSVIISGLKKSPAGGYDFSLKLN